MTAKISKFNKDLIEEVRKVLPKCNALLIMADSGSKGKDLNIMQISSCLG